MGNANTVVNALGNFKPRELNQGGTSTTKTPFTTDGSTAVVCYLPSSAQFSGANPGKCKYFQVRAWGRVVTSGTLNFTASLQLGTSATAASNSDIEDSGTTSLASLTTNWSIDAKLLWDGDSNRINGSGTTQVHTTLDAWTTIDNAQTSIDPDGGTTLGFVVCGTFGTGAAGNKCYLDGFQIDEI
jgi:hypothetical protein